MSITRLTIMDSIGNDLATNNDDEMDEGV